MTIKEIRRLTNLSQPKFCEKYGIPLQTFRKWEQGHSRYPDYVAELLEFKVREDLEMKDEFGRTNNKAQAIRSLDKLRMAHLLRDIAENPNKYPKDVNSWIEWLNAESGDSIDNL